jgi:hypothetical protein
MLIDTEGPGELPPVCESEASETIKRTRQLQGNIYALLARRITSTSSSTTAAPSLILTGSSLLATATRLPVLRLSRGEAINAPTLSAMFRQIISNKQVGGWRKLKREH